jgi:CheY-like chemotaxis protein
LRTEGHGGWDVKRDLRCAADQVIRRCLIVDDNERFLAVARACLEGQGLECPAAGFLSKARLSARAVQELAARR